MMLRSGLVLLATLAASGCGALLDRSDFKPLTPVEIAEIKAKVDAEKTAEDKASSLPVATTAPEGPGKPTADGTPATSLVTAVAPTEAPKASGLFASLFGGSVTSAEAGEVGPPKPSGQSAGAPPTAENVTLAKVDAAAEPAANAAIPAAPADAEEISEAELAGEDEADPDKVAVPKPPVDDGLEHDFVNVYTARPDRPQDLFDGLPGVAWQGNLVLASRGPDGDPRGLFGGEVQPYAHYVPGLPREVVQAANGLLLAHSAINVSCVKPSLLGMIRDAERHFSRRVVITSGYRSPSHNRRVRGALHSQHLYCNALDLYMPGIARDELARYFYGHPSRGGLGLYCHTKSIHVDTGKRREWRWTCRGRG